CNGRQGRCLGLRTWVGSPVGGGGYAARLACALQWANQMSASLVSPSSSSACARPEVSTVCSRTGGPAGAACVFAWLLVFGMLAAIAWVVPRTAGGGRAGQYKAGPRGGS